MTGPEQILASAFLDHCDGRAVSETQILKAEKKTAAQLAAEVKAGTFPMPAGYHEGEQHWRLGDVVRWREGWA